MKKSKSAIILLLVIGTLFTYALVSCYKNAASVKNSSMVVNKFDMDVVIDEKKADLLNMFKNELNFRHCGCEYLYKIKPINTSYDLFLKLKTTPNFPDVIAKNA